MNPNQLLRHAGVEMLRPEYAAAIENLAADPAITECVRLLYPDLIKGASGFIQRCERERAEGEAFVHALVARSTVLGLCGLHDVAPQQMAELRFWIGRPFWGNGLGPFVVGNMLDFAFGPLRLERVFCRAIKSAAALRHVIEKHGFRLLRMEPAGSPPDLLAVHEIARDEFFRHKYTPFLRDLSPDLKPFLDAELAAGNEIGDCTRGWPEKDSVIVALRKPFRLPTGALPPNVEYREVNDTHWWKAEYATRKPIHLLTCGF
jgi:RimJ/RimL family protein N-acetyltransferase